MIRKFVLFAALAISMVVGGCSGGTSDLAVPFVVIVNGGTSAVSPQFAALGGGIPAGVQVAFIGDVVVLRGEHMRANMRAFLGMNNQLARRPDSLLTTVRHLLPGDPFVYTDPVSGQQTQLEIEVKVEFNSPDEVRITIPPQVACNAAFTNPIVRLYGDAGSSFPETDVYFIVGPRCVALNPKKGVDIGGFTVTVHGDFFSPWTQIAFRYVDPADGVTKVVGNTAATDIVEHWIDRHTLVIPDWPGVVPNSTFGLAEELPTDVLLFENIDEITGNAALEPGLGGVAPCSALTQNSPDAPLVFDGIRNQTKNDGFTFLPTGVTDYPFIAGITPESGTELGGNTVVVHGFEFDAFSVDLSDLSSPGFGIECPPDSGNYIAPLSAILVDRETIVIVMPPCAVDIPETVNFCVRNKYSIDNPGTPGIVYVTVGVTPGSGRPTAGTPGTTAVSGESDPSGDPTCVVFQDIYTYTPIPPILPPIVTAIHPAGPGEQPQGLGNDYGLQRFLVVGDWFDPHTTLNGGFEFLMPGGELVQSLRTILHNRNLIEIFTKPLPAPYYPLTSDLTVDIRVRNVVGHADFENAMVFTATPDAGATPTLSDICPKAGEFAGGEKILIIGSNFDTDTSVEFGGEAAPNVQFVNAGLLIATVPASKDASGPDAIVSVVVIDDGASSAASIYTYTETPDPVCPILGALDPTEGSATGGYTILGYGVGLTPLTRVEFDVDLDTGIHSGNFSNSIFFLSDNLLLIEVPAAFPDQFGDTVGVGANDPLGGCPDIIKTTEWTWLTPGDCKPEVHFIDTSVEVPVTSTPFPALTMSGGDRMLVIGKCFDQRTTFDISKPQGTTTTSACTGVTVLTPNIAVMTSPASPDGIKGLADFVAHSDDGDSDPFTVEYVEPPPPIILDVRNLHTGTTDAPIDANNRLIIFGDWFVETLTVRITGCDIDNQASTVTRTFTTTAAAAADRATLVEDHLIGINVPPGVFCRGDLEIEVTTPFGTAKYEDSLGDPIFELIGPQPPIVTGVHESKFNSHGGQDAVFFGRNFTPTTDFSVRTSLMAAGTFIPVLSPLYVSETVVLVTMPALPGGMPPTGVPGDVRAEETDPALVTKLLPGPAFTVAESLFNVCRDDAPVLLSIHRDHGSTDGGEQVLLMGANFLHATGDSNITDIVFHDPALGLDIGDYTQAAQVDLPLDSLDPSNKGRFYVINDHMIILITHEHDKILPETASAPMNVTLESENGDSTLNGAYTYLNVPAELTPYLLGITPNETRLNGGSSHLISGGFLTSADRIVFTKGATTYTIPLTGGSFDEVNDNFLVFVMPDLSTHFAAGDKLDVHAEKDFEGSILKSNTLPEALMVTFAGPPTIIPTLSPDTGSAFGGDIIEITGTFFTSNSQVLFGTIPARLVVWESPTKLLVVTPSLPVDAPGTGLDLLNITALNGKVDMAVFTQGGWAVLADGFQFLPETPIVSGCDTSELAEGNTARVEITGKFFVPGDTTLSATDGTITNVEVHGTTAIHFDYTAKTFAPATSGPITDSITVTTTQGGPAAATCDIDVYPDPEITSCATTYSLNDHAAPTIGVEGGVLVKVTLKGINFLPGGTLVMQVDGNIAPVTLTEVGAFTGGGQFMVDDSETITFTAPNIFNQNVPTLLDGNPNIGIAAFEYTSPFERSADLDDCFSYVPTLIDFQSYAFSAPTVTPADSSLDKLASADVNQDGVPDVVVLARQGKDAQNDNAYTAPDGFVFLANTFGAGIDINGDGLSPDFAGTFTKKVISNDNVRVNLYIHGRGGIPRLANLDGDDDLEIILPVQAKNSGDDAALLIVDVNDDGTLGSEHIIVPSSISGTLAVSGIAIGNFDSADSGVDIAITIGAKLAVDRKIVLFKSTATDFVFTDSTTDLTDDSREVGYLEAGDFDDDGDDDLVLSRAVGGGRIIILKVNAATGTITSQSAITNVKGGASFSIVVFDANPGVDDKDDIMVLFDTHSTGTLVDPDAFPGIVVILDPIATLTADAFLKTGFNDSGRAIAAADYNGDGNTDLGVTSNLGETIVFLGDGKGAFTHSGRTWTLPTVPGLWPSRVHGIAANDMNRDGLAEILVGDIGANPMSLIVWLNTSR